MATVLQLAGMLPRDPDFRTWVALWMVPPREVDIDEATAFIRTVCEVTSRRELAVSREAEQRFHNFIRKPFLAWKENHLENAA